ncbi:uncharacterized protein APUU_40690A [Aspergillus puulaauensis]|uniref:Uncharacterized protein n=1 Tax=Aspergillus puulaauensis TaxID=1220207 RepID=A0A7R7XMG9_9EURO|nr:uncharacterized protein APUU_40690A [Aspergillus puulaauensis]BCS24246.1 hypothetical protein APUU_40690A [Aspergillus puulaauensis]
MIPSPVLYHQPLPDPSTSMCPTYMEAVRWLLYLISLSILLTIKGPPASFFKTQLLLCRCEAGAVECEIALNRRFGLGFVNASKEVFFLDNTSIYPPSLLCMKQAKSFYLSTSSR